MTDKECIEIDYVKSIVPDIENILKLYNKAGWILYIMRI